MIGKISARGHRVAGLIYYLYGPGRNEAHTDPHLVAGWRHPAELEPPLRADGRRDFRNLTGLLQQPHAALGQRGFERPVWHCSVRAAPGDRMLSDHEWAQVARDIMHRTGLAPWGQDDDAVRWIAVRHAPDHIHVVAMLARQDGTRPSFWNDRYRVGEACRAAEERLGLRQTAPRDRTGAPRPTRAESEKARRQRRSEPPRITLRRAVSTAAAAAASEREFFARLDAAGVSVRRRYSTHNPGEVTGYAVALPVDTTRSGGPVWYSGGKLAPDLTLPKLRHRWAASGAAPGISSPPPSETRSGNTPRRRPAARPPRSGASPVPIRAPLPTPLGPLRTLCMPPRRHSAARSFAGPPIPMPAPPGSPMGVPPATPGQVPASAGQPGCWPPPRQPWTIPRTPRLRSFCGWPP